MDTHGQARRKVANREPCHTVGEGVSLKIIPAIADIVKPVKEADIEFSEEGRDARVKGAPADPSELWSASLSATHIPFRARCSVCVASRAKADPRSRESGLRMGKRKGTTSYRSTSGSSATAQLGRRLRHVGSCVWRGVCSSYKQSNQ